MTVGELERGRGTPMSSMEMTEWRIYHQIKQSQESAGTPDSGGGEYDAPVMGRS